MEKAVKFNLIELLDVASPVEYLHVSLSLKLGENKVTKNVVLLHIEFKSVPVRLRGSRKKIKTLQLEYGVVFIY